MAELALRTISENVRRLLSELPPGVELVAAAKGASAAAVREAIGAGVKIIGESYIQEAEAAWTNIGRQASWHFIGHLQKNKVKKAVAIFDMIESVDSLSLAQELDRQCSLIGKIMPVLIEVNSGREPQKSGVLPEYVEELAREISVMPHLKLKGLMTIGPLSGSAGTALPYFTETRRLFEQLKSLNVPGIGMQYLSMGMSESYHVAIAEGANLIRIGTKIFGERTG